MAVRLLLILFVWSGGNLPWNREMLYLCKFVISFLILVQISTNANRKNRVWFWFAIFLRGRTRVRVKDHGLCSLIALALITILVNNFMSCRAKTVRYKVHVLCLLSGTHSAWKWSSHWHITLDTVNLLFGCRYFYQQI